MKSKRTRTFRKLFDKLPNHIRENARKQYKLFLDNPGHPSLRTKQIGSTRKEMFGIFEVSIGMGYRATYFVNGDTYVWFWIGTHSSFDTKY